MPRSKPTVPKEKAGAALPDHEAIRRWKAGMEAANAFDLEQARKRTPVERLVNHQRFLEDTARFGLALSKPEDRLHYMPYHEVQERWLARYSERKLGG